MIKQFANVEVKAFMAQFIQLAQAEKKLDDITDEEIGKLLFDHVWANIDITSPQSLVVEQAYLRLGFDPNKAS